MRRLVTTYFWYFIFVPCYSIGDIISIENPLNNAKHCLKFQMEQGAPYDPDVDHLLEDGCKYPVRQNVLERDFREVVYKSRANESIHNRVKVIVERRLIDWESFKRSHLDIPEEFSKEVDGYAFVDDVNPLCSQDHILFLRLCFSKNPTRRFGRPHVFQSSDGILYQFQVDDRYLSSSDCTISGNFGRCRSKRTPIVFRMQRNLETSSVTSQMIAVSSWTFCGTIGSVIFFVLLLVIIGGCYKYRDISSTKKPKAPTEDPKPHFSFPVQEIHRDIPFIDDAIVFDI